MTVSEADQVIEKFLLAKNGIFEMRNTFNTAVVNTLWQIVASKRLESDDPRTEKIIEMVNSQVEGVSLWNFFPNIRQQFPPNFLKQDRDALQIKSMMKELIAEHLQDIDYENPRDFMDVYLTQMNNEESSRFHKETTKMLYLFFGKSLDCLDNLIILNKEHRLLITVLKLY